MNDPSYGEKKSSSNLGNRNESFTAITTYCKYNFSCDILASLDVWTINKEITSETPRSLGNF